MSLSSSFRISASALTAQRLKMDVISGNIANVSTTRTAGGGPYRRREVVFGESPAVRAASFGMQPAEPSGVRVLGIAEQDQIRLVNDPKHPDADANGYVAYPDIDLVQEMSDMMAAVRSYEASVQAMNAIKGMALKALEIGRG